MKHRTRRKPDFRIAWAGLFIISLLTACQPHVVCHSFRSVSSAGLKWNDTLRFEAVLPDSTSAYALCVELRHRVSYPYCELPLLLTVQGDSLTTSFADTLQVVVADGQGHWASSGWSDLRTVSSPLLFLPAGLKDTCRITLTSLLPDSLLPGVSDIGIKILSPKR